MFRSVLVLVLVNLYGRGLGIPTPENNVDNNNMVVHSALYELANQCPVQFITKELRGHLKECNISIPLNEPNIKMSTLQCLMYYEINLRICNTLTVNNITQIDPENQAKLGKINVLDNICSPSTEWSIGILPKYPLYKVDMEKIFNSKSSALCIKFCGLPGEISDEVNHFCNYYQWGLDILKTISSSKKPTAVEISRDTTKQVAKPEPESSPSALESTNVGTGQYVNITSAEKPISPPVMENNEVTAQKSTQINNNQTAIENSVSVSQIILPQAKESETKSSDHLTADNKNSQEPNLEIDKPMLKTESENKAPIEKEIEKALEASKDKNTDFQTGYQGEGDNYDNMNTDDYDNSKPEIIPKKPTKNIVHIGDGVISDSVYKGNPLTYREMGIAEVEQDDDHFFTVFLTGVMLVVFLYVLYHNKSKVTKVVLGLIVEGRQNGRRRNSRGHAYRRLDTLEQAMSSNTTAPPTKIIY